MQKQKIDPHSLILHSDYDSVSCGLFSGITPLATVREDKLTASKNLMLRLTTLLRDHNVSWSDLFFIGVNQGPSPFTTLRVVITTVNGLLFAKKIPLVGVDGLHAFLNECSNTNSDLTVAVLNAFNKDVYFGIQHPDGSSETGWSFYGTFLDELHKKYTNKKITFIGNGVTLYRETILSFFPTAHIPHPLPETASLQAIAQGAVKQWNEGMTTTEPLLPLYLKTMDYKPSC